MLILDMHFVCDTIVIRSMGRVGIVPHRYPGSKLEEKESLMLNFAGFVATLIATIFIAAIGGNVWLVAFNAFLAGTNATLVVYQILKE